MKSYGIIKLSDIDICKGPALTLLEPSEALIGSIRSKGIVEPPVVLRKDGSFLPVTGVLRLKSAMILGIDETGAIIMDDEPYEKALLMAVESNLYGRGLKAVEEALYISMLKRYFSEKNAVCFLQDFSIHKNRDIFYECDIVAGLKPEILGKFAAMSIPWIILRRFLTWDAKSIEVILEIFANIHLSFSKQRILVDYIENISGLTGRLPHEILLDKNITEILNMQNPVQRGDKVMESFRKKSFPGLTKTMEKYEKLLMQARLPSNITLTPPPSFEGKNFRLTGSVTSVYELKKLAADIKRLSSDTAMASILEL